jgi:hypothetical protein
MRFRYSLRGAPPELIVPAVVSAPGVVTLFDIDAKIDTGADMTVVPAHICEALGLQPKSWVPTHGALGQSWQSTPTFMLSVRIAGGNWMRVEVVKSPKDYMLLGRDLLNRYVLTANGPAGHFELDLPPGSTP